MRRTPLSKGACGCVAILFAVVLVLVTYEPVVALGLSDSPAETFDPSSGSQPPRSANSPTNPGEEDLSSPVEDDSRPIPEGEVTQSWDNDTPIVEMEETFPVDLLDDGLNVTHRTPYGTYVVRRDSPQFVRMGRPGEPDVVSMFVVRYRSTLLRAGNGTVDYVSGATLKVHYEVFQGTTDRGTVWVTYYYGSRSNKVTATFVPASKTEPSRSQIVWLAFTTYQRIEVPGSVDGEVDFSALGSPPKDIGHTGYVARLRAWRGSAVRAIFNFTDAQKDWVKTEAGVFSFGVTTGNAVLVSFALGNLTIDPQLITSSAGSGSLYSAQRKTFFDGERYWAFWYDTTIRYASSLDGKSWPSAFANDVPGMPEALPHSFTVANFGKNVVVMWGSHTPRSVKIAAGLIDGNWIKWASNSTQPRQLDLPSEDFTGPVLATFTPRGDLAYTFTAKAGSTSYLAFARYLCTGIDGIACSWGRMGASRIINTAPGIRGFPVAFNGAAGYVGVAYAAPLEHLNVFVDGYFGEGTTYCQRTVDINVIIDDPTNYTAVAASGSNISIFWKDIDDKMRHVTVTPACDPISNQVIWSTKPAYLSAGTDVDGRTVLLFFTAGGSLYHWRFLPPSGGQSPESPSWLSGYPNPTNVTAAVAPGRFIPVLFMSGSSLYYISWPLAIDEISSGNPWSQSLGAPLVPDTGGVVNPATGLLRMGTPLVSIPSRNIELAVSLLYTQPFLFQGDPPSPYRAPGSTWDMRFTLDLPLVYGAGADTVTVGLPGGQAYRMTWDNPGSRRWANNTRGIAFRLSYDAARPEPYNVTMPSGAVYLLDSSGLVKKALTDATTYNYLTYEHTAGRLTKIQDISGSNREILIVYDGNRVDWIDYGNGRKVDFSYSNGVPQGCGGTTTDSGVLTITDVLGRARVYSVCRYLLTQVDLPTGGEVSYTYANTTNGKRIWQGTDTYSLPVLQVDVYDEAGAGQKARTTTFTYHVQNGDVTFAEVRVYNDGGNLQGTKEYRYRAAGGLLSIRTLDANGFQMRMNQNWFSVNDQPHYTDEFVGGETEPSSASQDSVDDWGNPIYTRDPYGNESFRSFANTNHQYEFHAPGSLRSTTSGKLYENAFDYYSHDWVVVSGSATLTPDDATFRRFMPSLKVTTGMGETVIERTFGGQSSWDVLFEAKLRVTSTSQEVNVLLSKSDGAPRAGVQFASDFTVRYKTSSGWSNCVWPESGQPATWTTDAWHRLTILAMGTYGKYSVYLGGIGICLDKLLLSGVETLDRFRVQAFGTSIVHFDDVRASRGHTIRLTGLGARQAAAIVAADGSVVNFTQTLDGNLVMSLNSPPVPTTPTVSARFNESAYLRLRVYAADGTLEFESPHRKFHGGDEYAYISPRTMANELVRTRSGLGVWTADTIRADDTLTPCSPTCTPAGVWRWLTRPAVSGARVHESPFGFATEIQEHRYQGGLADVPGADDFHVQYVYFDSSSVVQQLPAQVMTKFFDSTAGAWKAASWGVTVDPGPSGTKLQGPVPTIRDRWVQLLVKASEVGTSGHSVTGWGYETVGGQAFWDATARADSSVGTLQVTGLADFLGAKVSVYWANNDTLIGSGTTSGDSVSVTLYSSKLKAFPVLAKIRISSTNQGFYDYTFHLSSPVEVWGGDVFSYVGESGFYDRGYVYAPAPHTHSVPLGTKTFFGDCWDALVCYDMETTSRGNTITLGTGAVTTQMIDLSGKGNIAVISGARRSTIVRGASGLATDFDGVNDHVSAGDIADFAGTTPFTVSLWFYRDGYSNEYVRLISKEKVTSPREGWLMFIHPFNSGWANRIGFERWTSGSPTYALSTTATAANTLYHVVVTYDGSSLRMYVNGVLEDIRASTNSMLGNAYPLRIGANSETEGGPFWGAIDQVVIYGRALDANEVLGRYRSRLPVASAAYTRPAGTGQIEESRAAAEGKFLVSAYAYGTYGQVRSSTDTGAGAPGPNAKSFSYSGFYQYAYLTRAQRPDGKAETYSYDWWTGALLGTLTTDCKRIRHAYDVAGRPVETSYYDSDAATVLFLDMETPDSTFSPERLKDVSCNANSAVIGVATDAEGVQGRGRSFDGVASYLQSGDADSLDVTGPITLSAWVRNDLTGTALDGGIIWKSNPIFGSPAEKTYEIGFLDGTLWFQIGNGASSSSVNYAWTEGSGVWHHVVGVWDGTTNAGSLSIYVDGQLRSPGQSTITSIRSTSDPLYVGGRPGGASFEFFKGRIDEVQVLSRALTPTEVDALSRLEFRLGGRTAAAFDDMVATDGSAWSGYSFHGVTTYDEVSVPRTLFYDMQTPKLVVGGSTYLADLSGNGNHGRVYGATSMPTGGRLGGYYSFNPNDGTNDYVQVSSDNKKLNFTEEFTIAGWFRLNDTNNRYGITKRIASYCTSSSYALHPAWGFPSDGKPTVQVANECDVDTLSADSPLPTGVWRFLAATFRRGELRLFVDAGGTLVAYQRTSHIKSVSVGSARVTIGSDSGGQFGFMNGGIDEVQILDRALTDSQITDLYSSYFIPEAPIEKSHRTTRYFDGLGRETRIVLGDMFGKSLTTSRTLLWHDGVGTATSPSGGTSTYGYDFLSRILATRTAGDETIGGTTTWTYTDEDRKVETTDPVGRRTYQRSDLMGRVVEVGQWNPRNSTHNITRRTFNAVGLPTAADVILPSGAKQQGTLAVYYNTLGLEVLAVYPNGKTSKLTYTNNGQLFSRTDEMGRVEELTYNNLGNVIKSTLKPSEGSGTRYETIFGYDSSDNLAGFDNGTTNVLRLYDFRHRLIEETFAVAESEPIAALTVRYQYDAAGKMPRIDYPGLSNWVVFAYDTLGRVEQVDTALGGEASKSAEVRYDPFGRLSTIWYWDANVNTTTYQKYEYDARDRITQIKVATGLTTRLQLDYTYNRASDVTQMADDAGTGRGTKYHAYTYDGQGRLATALGPWAANENPVSILWSHDAVGNILTKTEGSVTTYQYNYAAWNRLDQTTGGSAATFEYNDAGSLVRRTQGTVTDYTYDFSQRLVKVVSGSSASSYYYDGIGRRLKVEEGAVKTYFAHAGTTPLYAQQGPTSSMYVYLGGLLLLRRTSGETTRFYHQDLSQNVRLVWYYSGGFAAEFQYRYKPFGELVVVLGLGGTDPRFKFAGQELDSTGLYHMGARYQDAPVGRFHSRDPVGSGYSYASNNPISLVDPTGLYTEYPATYFENRGMLWVPGPVDWGPLTPLVDVWNSIPKFWRDVVILSASILIIGFTGGTAAPFILAAGLLAGTAFLAYQVASGITDSFALFNAFSTGFFIGTIAASIAVSAWKGIMYEGDDLAESALRGSGAPTKGVPEGVPIKGRTIVVGEHQPSVLRFAEEHGYDTMPRLPATMSRTEKLAANRAWIRARMDEGYWIVDLGPSPLKTNYPYITSPYYAMERAEIAARGYSRWLPVWGM